MKRQEMFLQQQRRLQIKVKGLYLNIVLLTTTLLFNGGCASDTNSKQNIISNDSTMQKSSILIGYDSLPIFLGNSKSDIDKLINLKWDRDNDANGSIIGYYAPPQTINLDKLKGNLDLYFTFNKNDSTLRRFNANLVFDNYDRDKIISDLKEELMKKFANVIDFSSEEISSGDEQAKKYKGYEVKIKLDTALYSPSFYYMIESVK